MFGISDKKNAAGVTDLAVFGKRSDHETAQELRVKLPSGELSDIRFSCLGYLSDAFAQAKQDLSRAVLDGEPVGDAKSRLLSAVVVGWSGLTENGEPVPYSPAKAAELMREYPDLAEQVDTFISRNENFMKG